MSKRKTDTAFFLFTCLVTLYTVISLFFPRAGAKASTPAPTEETAPAATAEPEAAPEDDARELYVSTWAERIDAFNAGYPLEGYGRTFAEAAYDYGIDPRLPPAIARVESGSGEVCFNPYNAWGWGDEEWSNWTDAIHAHVQGLAENYGYDITEESASRYADGESDVWFEQVESFKYEIWESDAL